MDNDQIFGGNKIGIMTATKRKAKYNNAKAVYNGIKFDSKKEMQRYKALAAMERQGLISCLELQKRFEVCPKRYGNRRARNYIADFVYIEGGRRREPCPASLTLQYKKRSLEYFLQPPESFERGVRFAGVLKPLVLLVCHTCSLCDFFLGTIRTSLAEFDCEGNFRRDLDGIAAREFRFCDWIAFFHAYGKNAVKRVARHYKRILDRIAESKDIRYIRKLGDEFSFFFSDFAVVGHFLISSLVSGSIFASRSICLAKLPKSESLPLWYGTGTGRSKPCFSKTWCELFILAKVQPFFFKIFITCFAVIPVVIIYNIYIVLSREF